MLVKSDRQSILKESQGILKWPWLDARNNINYCNAWCVDCKYTLRNKGLYELNELQYTTIQKISDIYTTQKWNGFTSLCVNYPINDLKITEKIISILKNKRRLTFSCSLASLNEKSLDKIKQNLSEINNLFDWKEKHLIPEIEFALKWKIDDYDLILKFFEIVFSFENFGYKYFQFWNNKQFRKEDIFENLFNYELLVEKLKLFYNFQEKEDRKALDNINKSIQISSDDIFDWFTVMLTEIENQFLNVDNGNYYNDIITNKLNSWNDEIGITLFKNYIQFQHWVINKDNKYQFLSYENFDELLKQLLYIKENSNNFSINDFIKNNWNKILDIDLKNLYFINEIKIKDIKDFFIKNLWLIYSHIYFRKSVYDILKWKNFLKN